MYVYTGRVKFRCDTGDTVSYVVPFCSVLCDVTSL